MQTDEIAVAVAVDAPLAMRESKEAAGQTISPPSTKDHNRPIGRDPECH
jgi:hypothetical protein